MGAAGGGGGEKEIDKELECLSDIVGVLDPTPSYAGHKFSFFFCYFEFQ